MNKTSLVKLIAKNGIDLLEHCETFEEEKEHKRISKESIDNLITTRDETFTPSDYHFRRNASLRPSEIIYLTNNQPKLKVNNNNSCIRRIFEEFLTVGIEYRGLEYITDIDTMMLAPKITGDYPNMVLEHELR